MEPVTLMAELWFETEPQLDLPALAAAVPGAEVHQDDDASRVLAHPRFVHTYEEGKQAPIYTALLSATDDREPDHVPTTEQTWDWAEADAVLARCTHSVLVAEMLGRLHPFRDRLEAYIPTLCAAIERFSPAAVWLPNSARVAHPRAILEQRELVACLNVRLFRVEDSDEALMDTLGLHALGLPDLQRVFSDEDPGAIAGRLYDTATYLLEHGDVIEPGHTVGEPPWRAAREPSLAGPERSALTFSPA